MYLQQNCDDAKLSPDEIKEMISNGKINSVIKNLQRYVADIPGTTSYWNSCRNDLAAIIESKGPPHAFFTHSYADFHDPYLHEFLKIPAKSPRNVIHKRLRKYPHLVNWFFIQKFKEFAKTYYIKYLHACPEKGGWLWYRFEWQSREAIHVHGLLRMGNIKDTYELANKCIKGHVISLKAYHTEEEKLKIIEGLNSEKELTKIFDKYINCDTITNITVNHSIP